MVIKKVSSLLLVFTMAVGNLFAQFYASKTYVISNRNNVNLYMQDNGGVGARVALGALNDNSYWMFEPTANENCFYVKNATTGLYMQSCNDSEVEVVMGTTPVEYCILDCSAGEGAGMYGMASTDQTTYNFTSGTIGCNWKNDNTVQGYAAVAGTNHRSFWKIVEQEIPQPISTFDASKKYTFVNFQDNNYYMKDGRTGLVLVETGRTSNALWQFEASGNDNCYYVRNALTGKYMQSTKTNEQPVLTDDTPLEIMVVNDPAKGLDVFGFASTDQDDLTFKDDKTFGANWNAGGYAQGYAVTLGGRDRSFWKVAEVPTVDFADDVDNTTAITDAAGNGKNAVVTRSMAKDIWNTLVVPHAMNAQAITRNFGEGAKVAALTSEAGGVLRFSTVTEIVAGKPYLVMPTIDVVNIITMNTTVAEGLTTDGGNSYKFVGLYAPTTIGTNDYFMAAGNTLMKNGAGGEMKAFRAYFQATSSLVKALVGFSVDETETGIIAPNGTIYEDMRIFNLAGQQVNLNNTRKGIFIINGKKVVVK